MLEDNTFRTLLDLCTFLWLLGWALKAARNLLSPHRDSVCALFLTHFVFCGIPLLLDEVVGRQELSGWRGFEAAVGDPATNLVYCVYVALCPVVWWIFGRYQERRPASFTQSAASSLRSLSWQWKTVLHLALIAPAVALFFAPNLDLYAQYAAVLRPALNQQERAFQDPLGMLLGISTIAGAALLLCQRRLARTLLYVVPFALLTIWLDGKRAIVVMIAVMYLIALWARGALRGRSMAVAVILAAIGFSLFSFGYQATYRGFDQVDARQLYDNYRLDFGRDNVIRSSLNAELHSDVPPILEYRGQSLLFHLVAFVPREVWPEKPWPYAIYATSAAFRLPVRYAGWGVTTSWLDEAIANFSWTGLLLGPLPLAWLCRIADRKGDSLFRLLTIMFTSLLLVIHMAALYPIALIWLSVLLFTRKRRAAVLPGYLTPAAIAVPTTICSIARSTSSGGAAPSTV